MMLFATAIAGITTSCLNMRACSPVTDLSYLIYLSTDAPMRAKYNSGLFNVYYDALCKQLTYFGCNIEECYPRAIFDNHLKEFLPYGLLMSTMVIPIMLSNKGTELDVVEMSKVGASTATTTTPYTEKMKDRLNGVVNDFIKLELI
ncbi:uncharacterized protein LOC143917645 [Arctopsyche grandis]|uniref:uncharacterized protein LOC143917645 n=1 Tax=Arctopsyche grandis TaxID=121162 RepID=UPI00406D6954